MVSHNLVGKAGLKNLGAEAIDWNDKETIHIGVCNLHFVPILKKVTLQKSPSYPLEIYKSHKDEDLKKMTPSTPAKKT